MSETKTFHFGDLLSITDGALVSPDHMNGVSRIIDFVTGQTHMIYQLPRAAHVVKPHLLQQHPWLAEVEVPQLRGEAEVMVWLAVATKRWGEYHEVAPMPFGQYVGREPIAELREMAPHAQIIENAVPPEEQDGKSDG